MLNFAAAHPVRMPLVTLVWLHDISAAEVADYGRYYACGSDCFARNLGSLGLRTHDGTDKPGFALLRAR